MAADSQASCSNNASLEPGSSNPPDSKQAASSTRAAAQDAAEKHVELGNDARARGPDGAASSKKRPRLGRAEYNRQQKSHGKEQKHMSRNDWREFKRRKVNARGEPRHVEERKNPFSKEEIAAEERLPKRKMAVMIGYSGTGYKGMQVNGDEPTIERDLFRAFIEAGAISKANADDPRKSSLARCARTDKGVHAAGNVISLKLIVRESEQATVGHLNELLPPQIRVWGIQRTNNSFNCYQYCDSRWYEYLLPSYCLLPPHPQTYLGRKIGELARHYDAQDKMDALMADVHSFWSDVEEKQIKPILAALDPQVRNQVLERIHISEEEESELIGEPNADSAPVENGEKDKTEHVDVPRAAGENEALDAAKTDAPASEAKDASKDQVVLTTVKPKHRELGPVDYALRDIKAAYVTAKRRYRVGAERLKRLQQALDKYIGSHNFHNYTVQKPFTDSSAKRYIKSFQVDPKPVIIGDTEWLSLKVHGQSFMMHQIRKMVGMVALLVRCASPLDRIDESYGNVKIAIPKAPGLGLLLERPEFTYYNRRAVSELARSEINFDQYNDRLEAFKNDHIYSRIFEVEAKENTFHAFFSQIDQFKSDHFLWLSAGGLSVGELDKSGGSKIQQDVSRELGDEDEDPEGGEG
ncbi:hypothetical protein CDD81_212 [Ophiocordyceps australis]|uniref:tRNA pseudouridine synthase 1 n=1 Tax=Ophiocordyceps australis TaxID=1399860 RepID=A0A2C5XBH6_9HYPO|nr:hypothetical protein CDD81_212 [Ophiocordyceps australis]